MNENGKNIIQQLFGQSLLTETALDDINAVTGKYPYFGPAQFMLAKKLRDQNNARSLEQLQKTALYFSNPFWLNYLLQDEGIKEIPEEDIVKQEETVSLAEDTKTETPEPVIEETQHETHEVITEEDVNNNNATVLSAEEPPTLENAATITEAQGEFEKLKEEDSVLSEQASVSLTEEATVNDNIEPAITEAHEQAIEETREESASTTEEEIIPDTIQEETTVDKLESFEPHIDLEKETVIEEEETPEEENEEYSDDEIEKMKLSKLIEQHLSDFKKPVTESEQLPYKASPYHTIDYFASQGIKADTQDKLTYKVKKFTDWLKQMKGTGQQPADLGTDAETERIIETIAQTSNETKDIVTEAMAEVLVKQGKTEKALQLYKKLSFLNPAKSTYFAAKIEELKAK